MSELVERLRQAIERMQEGDRPLPWVVHSGCSYRRIASQPTDESGWKAFADGNVLHALNQRSDGHPDLSMGERGLSAMVDVLNAAPALADRIAELEARVVQLQRERDDARLLVGRAQIVGGSLSDSWHHDARALNPSARSE